MDGISFPFFIKVFIASYSRYRSHFISAEINPLRTMGYTFQQFSGAVLSQFLSPQAGMSSRRSSVRHVATTRAKTSNVDNDDTIRLQETLTWKMFDRQDSSTSSMGSAGGNTSFSSFMNLDAAWTDIKTRRLHGMPPKVVKTTRDDLPAVPRIDVIVGGGTLGILVAAALQARGLRTAVIEKGVLRGRDQDWNISRKELYEFVEAGVLSAEQAEDVITIEFNPVKAGFFGQGEDIVTSDVLNLGVSPRRLIQHVRDNYTSNGGLIIESARLDKIWVHPNGVSIRFKQSCSSTDETLALAGKLFVDSMGNQSPIIKQVRHGQKPDGVCLVVGSCGRGFNEKSNVHGDIIRTISPARGPAPKKHTDDASTIPPLENVQLFYEAFPAGSGPSDRTTYMFAYMDATASRPSLLQMMEHYWNEMPRYQNIDLEDIEIQRILFGLFPTYRDSPLAPCFDRIVYIGDASGMQSPLSFGGFTALARHIGRLTNSIVDAVQLDCLDRWSLKYINPYNPSLSSAWMFQKAMSIPSHSKNPDADFINTLLGKNFAIMAKKPEILKPFLQDVIQAGPLTETLVHVMKENPFFVPVILYRVGLAALADWLLHYIALVAYTIASKQADRYTMSEFIEKNIQDPRSKFIARRALERWTYGSGLDH